MKQVLKKTFQPTKENTSTAEQLCVDKVINVVQMFDAIRWRNLLLLLESSTKHDCDNCNTCVNLWQHFLNLSNKEREIFSRKNEISVGSFT